MSLRLKLSAYLTLGGICGGLATANASERIRLNQVGFAFGQPKLAVSLDSASTAEILDSKGKVVFSTGKLEPRRIWSTSSDTGWRIDFSAFNSPGTYTLRLGSSVSHPFQISANPFEGVAKSTIKAFWYNRSSYALKSSYAGQWARDAGHLDNAVIIHKSAKSPGRDSGSTFSSPGGWYDAGDYGKYVSNAGISTWTLLSLYESAPAYFDTLSLNVASGSSSSDLLNEILWELRWLLTMQDPYDGGVYHSVTTQGFPGLTAMPSADVAKRYAVFKSTTATLNLAAVTAYAARVFRSQPALKQLSDSCLTASLRAFAWARDTTTRYDTFLVSGVQKIAPYNNTKRFFQRDSVYKRFKPTLDHGTQYNDASASDERFWAAAELFLTTQQDSFATRDTLAAQIAKTSTVATPTWSSTRGLGQLSLISNPSLITGSLAASKPKLDSLILNAARPFIFTDWIDGKGKARVDTVRSNLYSMPLLGMSWGSNGENATRGLLLWKAWQVSGDTTFKRASLDILDYLLGRNATSYSFVTGQGSKAPMNIHHRPSAGDGIAEPVPGFLVGGPSNMAISAGDGLKAQYSTIPAKSYLDNVNSFATNEVAINWNAPMAFLAGVWSAELTSHPSTGIVAKNTQASPLKAYLIGKEIHASAKGHQLVAMELRTLDGRLVSEATGNAASLSLSTQARGLFLVRGITAAGTTMATPILVP